MNAVKERALITGLEILQDLIIDLRRNGHDDRKRNDEKQDKDHLRKML